MQNYHRTMMTFVFCIAFTSITAAQAPKRFFLGIGVENYAHERLRSPEPLKYCVDDVTALGEFLKTQGYEVKLLTDETGKSDAKLAPTRANVNEAIKAILLSDNLRSEDTVIIALAGHGLQFAGGKEAYFCPVDARPFAEHTATLISISTIYADMEASFAKSKVLLVDACRNDPDPTRGRGGIDASTSPPPQGIAAFFSCAAGQKAFENDDLKHGVFFHFVLEGLSGRAKDEDNEVTLNTLANYVSKQVPKKVISLHPGRIQAPNLRFEQVGASPVLVKLGDKSIAATKPDSDKKMLADSAGNSKLKTRSAGEVQEFTDLKIKFCYCPPGKFLMGSPRDEVGRGEDEDDTAGVGGNQVEVELTKGFWIGQTEVTQKQWFDVMGTRPWRKEDGSLQDYVKERGRLPSKLGVVSGRVELLCRTKRTRT